MASNQNYGDPFVFYDQIADRWVITDFALVLNSFWECIGVSQTGDPAGTYYLYALQHDPANPNLFGDYPKFALWPDAYYLTMNLFSNPSPSSGFVGVRVYALDRASMISGGPTNAIGFTIGLPGVGYSYSLVPASFRTGSAPLAGEHEFLLAVDSTYPRGRFDSNPRLVFPCRFYEPGKFNHRPWPRPHSECRDHS